MKEMKYPNPKAHQTISFIKSIIRVTGYLLVIVNLPLAAVVLIASELLGILEELV